MLRLIVTFLLTLAAAYFSALLGPWWMPLLVCMVVSGGKFHHGGRASVFSALVMLTLWLGTAWYWSSLDVTDLSSKMASMFTQSLPLLQKFRVSSLMLVLIAFLAAVLGGLSGWAGVWFKRFLYALRPISTK